MGLLPPLPAGIRTRLRAIPRGLSPRACTPPWIMPRSSPLLPELLRTVRRVSCSSWAAISFRKSMPARFGCTFALELVFVSKKPATIGRPGQCRHSTHNSGKGYWSRYSTTLACPIRGINLTYSNSGTIGTSRCRNSCSVETGTWQSRQRDYVNQLRKRLPEEFPGVQFFFQPADIVTQILNFGTPAPIDVANHRPEPAGNYHAAQKFANQMRHIPGAVDVHVQQAFDAPTLVYGH